MRTDIAVVTGVRGFIGGHVARELAARGLRVVGTDLAVADAVPPVSEYLTAERLLRSTMAPSVVVHMGANANTMDHNRDRMMAMNYEYSKELAAWASVRGARLVYASSAAVYGLGEHGFVEDVSEQQLRPLNVYGESKLEFDRWMTNIAGPKASWMGLRFFNVFGSGEDHKGRMASMVSQIMKQVEELGRVRLFKSYDANYADGEQRRDYVYVRDVANVVVWAALELAGSGVINVGSGVSTTFNGIVRAVCRALGRDAAVEYIDMPEGLRSRYQYDTRASLTKLRRLGYESPFADLDAAVREFVSETRSQG